MDLGNGRRLHSTASRSFERSLGGDKRFLETPQLQQRGCLSLVTIRLGQRVVVAMRCFLRGREGLQGFFITPRSEQDLAAAAIAARDSCWQRERLEKTACPFYARIRGFVLALHH